MKRYRAYLFDFDGTLVDSMPVFGGVMLRLVEEENLPHGDDLLKIVTPMGYAGMARYLISIGSQRTEEDLLNRMHEYPLEEYKHRIPAKEHVIPSLLKLKEEGASLNVLTAAPHILLDPCLKRLGLYELFDHVWSGEDFHTSKTNPAIYRMAADALGLPIEDVLFLDDNYNADKSAKQSGIGVCGVFDPTSAEFENEIRAVADHYIYDFRELL